MVQLYRNIATFLCCLLLCGSVSAQSLTRVRGVVKDAITGEPVPRTSVMFSGTSIGVSTDKDGAYSLETREDVSKIEVSSLSYESQTIDIQRGAFNTIDIELEPAITQMSAVIVRAGVNPAHPILDSVIKYKYKNDPGLKESYRYNTYTKMDMSLANKTRFRNKKLQKNFGFVFENLDTSAITGQVYLPVMITESTSEYYYRKRPQLEREIITASRISGVEDYNFAQFTGALHVDINIYDNYINLFGVNVPSPLCDHGRAFYEYTLMDRIEIDGRKTYFIYFEPKSLASPVFQGEIYIDETDWALRSAKMRLAKDINVNWLRSLYIENLNDIVDDGSTWFKKQDRIMADLSLSMSDSSKLVSIMGQREINYSDIEVNVDIPKEIVDMRNNMAITPEVLKNDEEFWAGVRPYELSEREKDIYAMVDSVKNVPMFRTIYDVINTFVIGYQKTGPVEIGSIYKAFSFNKLEGARFQLGIRTNADFSRTVRLGGYGAYGTKDKEFKGGGDIEFMFRQRPYSKLTLSGSHDVLQLSAGRDLFATGNLFSSVFARGETERLVMQDKFALQYQHEWIPGIENTIALEWRDLSPSEYVPFTRPDGTSMQNIRSSEVILSTRLSKNEVVHYKPFDRVRMDTKFPILNIELAAGLKGVLDSDYEYYRTILNIDYKFNIPPLGRSHLDVTAGKIFGHVPYPLLKMHEGNATYFYDKNAFSCMDFYEFASDTWASLIYEHNFKGFILGHIPLIKKLKWREVFIYKMLWGSLSDRNNGSMDRGAILDFPAGMTSVSKPYIETGVGIENIFRIIRVNAVWRLTHRDNHAGRKVDNFAINVGMQLSF